MKKSAQSLAQTSLKEKSQTHPSNHIPKESQEEQRQHQQIKKSKIASTGQKQQQKACTTNEIAPGSLLAYNNMKIMQTNNQDKFGVELDDHVVEDMSNELPSVQDYRVTCQEEDISNNQNEANVDQEIVVQNASSVAVVEKKRHRGRSILTHLHRRIAKDHQPILLNDSKQPIGPSKKDVDDLIHFIGTVAKDPILTPLNCVSWKHVPTKDKIWDYVTKRFDVPDGGKKFVLRTINEAWKLYKYRLKKATYDKYETMKERLANRPQHIPENQFKELLEFWDSKLAQEISKKNKESVKCNQDYHTTGPCSYAMKRTLLKQRHPNKKSPSQAEVYIESRKRVPGRSYKTDHMHSLQNIEKMKEIQSLPDRNDKGDPYYDVITKKEHSGHLRLHGRTVTKSNLRENEGKAPFVLPQMYMDSIEEYLEKKITSKILSQLQEANPGINIKIPNLTTTPEDGDQTSESSENEDECSNQDHEQDVEDDDEN